MKLLEPFCKFKNATYQQAECDITDITLNNLTLNNKTRKRANASSLNVEHITFNAKSFSLLGFLVFVQRRCHLDYFFEVILDDAP